MIFMKQQIKNLIALSMMIVFCMAIAGCAQQNDASSTKTTTAPASSSSEVTSLSSSSEDTTKPEELAIKVYFSDDMGEKLIGVQRNITVANDEDKYKMAVEEIINGPKDSSEGIGMMPKDTKVLSVKVDKKGIATVDFSKEFKQNFSGGSTGELMLIGSIVDTLTEFDEVKSVQFTIEGKQLSVLSGHLDLSQPQTRMKDLL